MDKLRTKRQARLFDASLPKKIAAHLCAALAGFCLSAVRFEGELAPFGAAFAAGAARGYHISAAVGAAAGALLFQPSLSALKYVSAAVLAVFLRYAYERFRSPGRELWIYPLFSFAAVTVSAGVIGIAAGMGEAWPVTVLCEGLISGAAALFFYRAFQVLPAGAAALGAGAGDTVAVLFSGSLLLLSLDGFRLWGVSFAHVLAYAAVLLLGFCGGGAAGTAAGVAAGLMLGFSPESVFLAYFLPTAGLLCGVLAGYGRLAAAGAFAVLGAMFVVLRGTASAAAVSIAEIVFAALAFALIPKRWMAAWTQALRALSRERTAGQTRDLVRLRLRGQAKAVRDIADSAQAVCRMFSAPTAPVPLEAAVRARVCAACVKREICWGASENATRRAFAAAEKLLRENGALSPEELPAALGAACADRTALISAFERALWEQNAALGAKNEICDVKTAAAAQFGSMAAVLEDAAQKTAALGEADPYLAALAREAFRESGVTAQLLCVSTDENGHALVEAFCTGVPRLSEMNALLERLRRKTNVAFEAPVQDEYKREGAVLSFCEKTALRVSVYRRSAPAAGENLCGDTATAFADGRGRYFCVLSDGMGTGKTAAVDSVMTCTLFARLMRSGFSPETALGAVNCALMVKSEDETLATLDLLQLDLYTGSAAFYKAGGARSVVLHAGKTLVVEPSSLPLGIMREVKFESAALSLAAGDVILMLSDGAAGVPRAFFKELFSREKDAPVKEIAEAVLQEALRRAPIGHADDITAVCLRIEKNDPN